MIWQGYDWTVYDGHGLLGQAFAADHARVNKRGQLAIKVGARAGGGVAMRGADQVYGTWKARIRMSVGTGSKYVLLLWPKQGPRPEVDFAEGSKLDPNRSYTTATFHRDMDGNNTWFHSPAKSFARWRTVGVRWRPGSLVFTIGRHVWAIYKGADAPAVPMHLAIQATRFACGPRATLKVAWVKVTG